MARMSAASYDYDVLHYDQAKRMLGVVRNPTMTPSDEVMKQVAGQMGVEHTFGLAPVGVFFGRDGRKEPGVQADDPFFGGAGPSRRGCLETGEADPRPALGTAYRRLAPVEPRSPAVPPSAPAALRLPIARNR